MKQNLIADYSICIIFRVLSFFSYILPKSFLLFLGRVLGCLIYIFDAKHRAVALANLNKAAGKDLSYAELNALLRKSYQAFGQNLIEISFIPQIDKIYLDKYIHIENKEFISQAFKRGKGVIFLAVHEGNWELSNIICANLGFDFTLFVRDQGFPRLNQLLNSYRLKRGCKIIHKQNGLRDLVEVLKSNQSIGMTGDQGGKSGVVVDFFGFPASMPTGAVKLALKYDCAIIPVFYTRVKGLYTKVILDQVYEPKHFGLTPEDDVRNNLQELVKVFEKYIRLYPHEYLWTYKIWKYGLAKQVLILSDGKAGHLRQSESLAKLISDKLKSKGIEVEVNIIEVNFKNRLSRGLFTLASNFGGKYRFRWVAGRLLEKVLTFDSCGALRNIHPDFVVSAGSGLCALNYFMAKFNQAKSICLMRPSCLGIKKFDLVIIPQHDKPKDRGNVVVTEGALNLIDRDYLKTKKQELLDSGLIDDGLSDKVIGLLIGGNNKNFVLNQAQISQVIQQVKQSAEELVADILVTTSRRTPVEISALIKKEFSGFSRCKLLIVANESNLPAAIGGILGLSDIIITSAESISMISEAANSAKYVLVFKGEGLGKKHRSFVKNYADNKYIYLTESSDIKTKLTELINKQPEIILPQDNFRVSEALERIL